MSRTATLLALLLLGCGPKAPPVASSAENRGVPDSPPGGPDPSAVIPTDPSVDMGTLDNGLSWFVEENDKPAGRAELRLVIKAGSVLEDDDQLGLAHFLEHMAFNGSENFEGNALIEAMEAMGMEFGAHVNASTSFDQTIYQLTVPTDDPLLLETGLRVLRDQAGSLLLDPEEVEAERGVVLEEWRGRQGAGSRLAERLVRSSFAGSIYGERLPIGTEESLKTFDPAALERFYEDWYRPELMAVIAVGDFDSEVVQALVEQHFSDLEDPAEPRPRPQIGIPARDAPEVLVLTDPEIPRVGFSFSDQIDSTEDITYGGYVDLLVRSLFIIVLNERLATVAQEPEASFLGAGGGWQRINATEAEWTLGIGLREDQLLEGIEDVMLEVERMRRHGVTEAEISRARAAILASYERMYREREKTSSGMHTSELIRVFTTGEAMPGTEAEYGFVRAWLGQLGKPEVDLLAATFLQQGSPVVHMVMPDKEGLAAPEPDQVWAAISRASEAELEAHSEDFQEGPLLDPLPPEGTATVVDRSVIEELQLTIWTLSNGVSVWLKPTDFQDDQVLLRASSQGGLSAVSDEDYVAASTAIAVASKSGLGQWDPATLSKALRGTRAFAAPSIGRWGEGMSGSSPPDEVEQLLQLVTLHFTQPRFTEDGLARYRRDREEGMRNRLSNPGAVFGDAINELLWEPGIRTSPWTVETLDQLDLEASEAFYEARFADASDFTWMLVGNIDPDALEPLLLRYLGNLPTTDAPRETWTDDGLRRKTGDASVEVRAGLEPKAQVRLGWHGPFESTWLSRNRLQATEDILGARLLQVLREDMGGVYSVGVSAGSWERPEGGYSATISFSCDPERVDELTEAALAEVRRFVSEPVSPEELAVEQEQNRRDREERVRSNGFWAGAIISSLDRGDDPRDLLGYDERNESLSAEEIQAMAAQVFAEEASFTRAVLLPKEDAE